MSFSTAVIVSLLFFCISDASASVIPGGVTKQNLEQFNVHIVERGTKYVEKIAIDEKNDLEYFQVPAHNGLTEADYLYDFKSKISVRRDKSNAACYVGPLPDDLPKPGDLRNDLQRVSQSPSNSSTVIVRKYWSVSEKVDKALLSQAVQDFCGQFPVYRLQNVDLNLNGRTRFARQSSIPDNIGFCSNGFPSTPCNPQTWLYSLKIRQNHCTWWVRDCRFDSQQLTICNSWNHLFSSMVCYTVRCPSG